MNKFLVLLISSSLLSPLVCFADSDKKFAVGANVGSRGIGFDGVIGLNDQLNLRASYSQHDVSETFDEDGIRYSGDFELNTTGLMLDYYPFSGTFRLSGGYFKNSTQLFAAAVAANGTVNINGYDYDISDEFVNINMDWKSNSPYLGIGWGNSLGEGSNLTFTLDIGVLLTGEPTAKLTASQGLYDDATTAGRDLQADLTAEENAINDSSSDFDKYPVIQIGLTYAF